MAYSVRIMKLGAEITNINLSSDFDNEVLNQLKNDLHRYRLLVVRDQGVLTAERQVAFTKLFGEVEDAGFVQHPKSPHRSIMRVSNDDQEGFRDIGTSGFHIDGSFMEMPNAYAFYHIITLSKQGTTAFIPLNELYESLPEDKKIEFSHLFMVKTFKYIPGYVDKPGYVVHPLVYNHPITGLKTMCIHQGKTSLFVRDYGTASEFKLSKAESIELLKFLDDHIKMCSDKLQYSHEWRQGDLLMSDNLAIAHCALPDTQLAVSDIGLRVMHRTVVKGIYRPRDFCLSALC